MWGALISAAASMISQNSAQRAAQEERDRQEQARKEALGAMNKDYTEGTQSFEKETGAPIAELGQARKSLAEQSSEAQQQAAGQTASNLAMQGVRGGQAARLQARQAGELGANLGNQLNQMALQEAKERRGLRSTFYGQKAGSAQTARYGMMGQA